MHLTESGHPWSAGHSKTAPIRGRRCVSALIAPSSRAHGSSSTTPLAGRPST